jgi:phosphoribosylanthranilate isomerase
MIAVPEVKVCGITRLEDGQNAISLGASFLGFILFEGSPRYIDPETARKIWHELNPSQTFSVAVVVDPDPSFLREICQWGFDFFQLHFLGSVDPDRISEWSEIVGSENLWLAPKLHPSDSFPEQLLPFADTFLMDAYSEEKFGGTGEVSDWKGFGNLKARFPSKTWVLAGGLSPQNLSDALCETSATRIDLNSGIESEPGMKDFSKMKKAFSLLRDHN